MAKVIFDSSFLLAVADRHTSWMEDITDALGKCEPILIDAVKEELLGLAGKGGRKGKSASVALEISAGFGRGASGKGPVDDEVMSAALSNKAAVATNDRALASSLRAMHVRVFALRGGRVWEK
ncbi:MAG TPA: hypothetical protein VEB67_01580 [Nitrososphaerales archaeon]|nr:hypothetical protein [Nitrososphaerales archaeon]